MITFDDKLFLFQEIITVKDMGLTVKNVPDDLITKVKEPKPHNVFYVKFAEKLPENVTNTNNLLFSTYNIDEKFVKKSVIKEGINARGEKVKYMYFPNLCMPRTASLELIYYLFAYLFNISHNNILAGLDYENGNQNLCSNTPRDFAKKEPGYIFVHSSTIKFSESAIFNKIWCLGFNHNLNIFILPSDSSELVDYAELFYKNYYITLQRFKHILDNVYKQNLQHNRLHLSINYTQISVMLAYHAPVSAHVRIDISKLFNIHHPWNYSKIYVHSDNIDNFLSNPRAIQYVKTNTNVTNAFKGVEPLFNTCALYVGTPIGNGLTLHHIEVFPTMNVNLVFTNINVNATWEQIESVLKEWIDTNYMEILKKAKLSEAIYSLDFKYEYYIPYFNKINGNVNLASLTLNDLDSLNELFQQETCNVRFKTRTSIEFNVYEFMTVATKQNYMYLKGVHEFITTPITYKELMPGIHVGTGDTGGNLTFKGINSYGELLFTLGLVIGSFKKLEANDTTISHSQAIKAIDSNGSDTEKLDIEAIRKKATKYGKNLLKLLEKIDPRLFGPRKIGKGIRSFSGLCQKHKQRVVPITKEEYEYLHKIVPDSVANLANQSYEHQRVYLFCPYKKYPFLNYHTFPRQLCIVRCTTKSSNKTQYNFCAKDLGAEHIADINNKYENQTITLYNPLITKGRRCKLPEEFKMILVNFVLIKLNIDSNIMKYCKEEYDKVAFIIKRDAVNNRYLILTEYNAENDYVLIIQDEVEDEYFLVIDEKTSKPLIFSECPELMKFFIENIRKTNDQYNFFNYLEKIFKTQLSEKYNMTTNNILNYIRKTFNIKYVCQGSRINGIIWNNKLIMTPSMYWNFENEVGIVVLFKALDDVMRNVIELPAINELDEEFITDIYKDYVDEQCHMVKYMNVYVWIKPFELTAKWFIGHDVITFDKQARLMNQYNINMETKYSQKSSQIKILDIAEVLRNYIYIYLIKYDNIDVNEIQKQLQELGVVYDGKTFIDYVNNRYKMNISWRTSKINIDDFKEYFNKYADLNHNEIIKTIYTKLQEELTFKPSKTETISSKIITV